MESLCFMNLAPDNTIIKLSMKWAELERDVNSFRISIRKSEMRIKLKWILKK